MTTQVLVIGGGYAGVIAADRLMSSADIEVTVINPRPQFVERIRLHQRVADSHTAVLDFSQVLNARVRLVVGVADRIDASARTVLLDDGRTLPYDYLVYAVGSHSARPAVPGASEHAYSLSGLEDADRLRAALQQAATDAPIMVVGSGPTGIEVTAELAEAGRHVTLVCGAQLGPYLHENGRRRVRSALTALGVTIVEGAPVTAVAPDHVSLDDGRHLPSRVTIWTAGFQASGLARRSGLTTDTHGRLLTDETLTSVDDDRIVAAGDAADPSGLPLRMSCQAAIPLGSQAAATILSRIGGEPPKPIDSGFVGQCLSLGRSTGLFQFARTDDVAVPIAVGGRTGGLIKEAVCRSVTAALLQEAKRPGSFRWLPTPTRRRRALAARADERQPA